MNGWNAITGVLVLLGLPACDSPSGPAGGVTGTWALRSVAGGDLPALVSDWSNLLVLSDTLKFGLHFPDSFVGPLVLSKRRLGVPEGPPSAYSELYHLELDGSHITLRYACPPDADCLVDVRSGEIDGDTMTLSYTSSGSSQTFRSPLVYQRVR